MRRIACAALGFAVALLCGCSKRESAADQAPRSVDARVTGTIALSNSQISASGTQLEISLTDVSAAKGSVEVAKQTAQAPASFPAEYVLPYRSSAIEPQHRYTISARLLADGRPKWATDTAYAVITQGNPSHIDIQLVKVGASDDRIGLSTDAETSVIEAELHDAAGLSTYRAHFNDAQLARLDEIQGSRRTSYEYNGARLRLYTSTSAGIRLQMEFDERGRLLRSTRQKNGASSTTASNEDIDAVRNRSALLRSHALAQKEIQAHAFAH